MSADRAFTIDNLRERFPITREYAYFQSYRRGPLPLMARQAVDDALDALTTGAAAVLDRLEQKVEDARRQLARLLDAPGGADELAFFRCTADAISAVAGAINWRDGDEVLITDREYPANVYPWMRLADRGVTVRVVQAHSDGRIPVEAFKEHLTPRTRLVAASSVYFSTGWRMPVGRLADLCREWGALLLIDAVQSIGAETVSVPAHGADFVVGDSRKFLCGLDGAAFLWTSGEMIERLQPPSVGAMSVVHPRDYLEYDFTLRPDARRFEPGAHATASLVALHGCLTMWQQVGIHRVHHRIDHVIEQLLAAARGVPGLQVPDYPPAERSAILAMRADPGTIPARRDHASQHRVMAGFRDNGDIVLAPHGFTSDADVTAAIDHVIRFSGP